MVAGIPAKAKALPHEGQSAPVYRLLACNLLKP